MLAVLDPAGHESHEADPVVSLYVPISHAVQVPPSEPEYPMLQIQPVILDVASGELALVAQDRHADDPVVSLY